MTPSKAYIEAAKLIADKKETFSCLAVSRIDSSLRREYQEIMSPLKYRGLHILDFNQGTRARFDKNGRNLRIMALLFMAEFVKEKK